MIITKEVIGSQELADDDPVWETLRPYDIHNLNEDESIAISVYYVMEVLETLKADNDPPLTQEQANLLALCHEAEAHGVTRIEFY